MVKTAANFSVAIVDIPGHAVKACALAGGDPHHIAVGHPEFLLAVRGNEADTLFSLFHVPVKQVPAICVNMSVNILIVRGTAEQVGVVLGISPKRIFIASTEATFRVVKAIGNHRGAVLQHKAVPLVNCPKTPHPAGSACHRY